jgi:hypothetical protein
MVSGAGFFVGLFVISLVLGGRTNLCEFIGGASYGAICGYFAGVLISGVFLVIDEVKRLGKLRGRRRTT